VPCVSACLCVADGSYKQNCAHANPLYNLGGLVALAGVVEQKQIVEHNEARGPLLLVRAALLAQFAVLPSSERERLCKPIPTDIHTHV
jgi:hypothetical protein